MNPMMPAAPQPMTQQPQFGMAFKDDLRAWWAESKASRQSMPSPAAVDKFTAAEKMKLEAQNEQRKFDIEQRAQAKASAYYEAAANRALAAITIFKRIMAEARDLNETGDATLEQANVQKSEQQNAFEGMLEALQQKALAMKEDALAQQKAMTEAREQAQTNLQKGAEVLKQFKADQ